MDEGGGWIATKSTGFSKYRKRDGGRELRARWDLDRPMVF